MFVLRTKIFISAPPTVRGRERADQGSAMSLSRQCQVVTADFEPQRERKITPSFIRPTDRTRRRSSTRERALTAPMAGHRRTVVAQTAFGAVVSAFLVQGPAGQGWLQLSLVVNAERLVIHDLGLGLQPVIDAVAGRATLLFPNRIRAFANGLFSVIGHHNLLQLWGYSQRGPVVPAKIRLRLIENSDE